MLMGLWRGARGESFLISARIFGVIFVGAWYFSPPWTTRWAILVMSLVRFFSSRVWKRSLIALGIVVSSMKKSSRGFSFLSKSLALRLEEPELMTKILLI